MASHTDDISVEVDEQIKDHNPFSLYFTRGIHDRRIIGRSLFLAYPEAGVHGL